MKQIFTLFIASILMCSWAAAQCSTEFDWGSEVFGVSPDPALGETFADGEIDLPYSAEIHVLVPENSSALLDGTNFAIDSVRLDSVTLIQGGVTYTLDELGLELVCNNNGTLPNPCAFEGGQTGCGTITGTPLVAGEFNVTVHGTIFAFLTLDFPFSGYTLFIDDGTSVEEVRDPVVDLRVTPNPFSTNALVEFRSSQAGLADFKIYTLLGEEKYSEQVTLTTGHNKFKISSSDLESGIYLYHIELGEFRVTKRLVVNK